MKIAFALIAVAAAGCSSLLGIDDLRLADDAMRAPDAAGDAAGTTCLGGGLLQVCPDPPPTSQLVITGPQQLDTGSDPSCVAVRSGGVEVCVVVHASIEIAMGGTLRVIGPRPLVLASMSSISILGTLDAASYFGKLSGAGADPKACPGIAAPGGSAGGAGGSFGGLGGNGGNGGSIAAPAVLVTEIRGGCTGGRGGGSATALPGPGGGALYLMAGEGIAVEGRINASGAGGGGPSGGFSSSGGGGAGAGGLIGLDAPAIGGAGTIFANGGGGGGGGGTLIPGNPGGESTAAKTPGPGGDGNGAGGDGSVGTRLDGSRGVDGQAGGGGGGGAGAIYVRGALAITGAISPPPTTVMP